jgi:hypothetical protein
MLVMMMRSLKTCGLLLLIAVGVYLGSYFALVQRGPGEFDCGLVAWYPVYRFSGRWPCGLVGTIYEPANRLDRRFLRPKLWAEKLDLAALLAADLQQIQSLQATNSVTPPNTLQPPATTP